MNEDIEEVVDKNENNLENDELKINISVSENEIELPAPKRNRTIEDVIKNYFKMHNMSETLGVFVSETPQNVPQNEEYSNTISIAQLEEENQRLKLEMEKLSKENGKMKMYFDSLKKGYDFHRNEHRRLIREKNGLVNTVRKYLDKFPIENFQATSVIPSIPTSSTTILSDNESGAEGRPKRKKNSPSLVNISKNVVGGGKKKEGGGGGSELPNLSSSFSKSTRTGASTVQFASSSSLSSPSPRSRTPSLRASVSSSSSSSSSSSLEKGLGGGGGGGQTIITVPPYPTFKIPELKVLKVKIGKDKINQFKAICEAHLRQIEEEFDLQGVMLDAKDTIKLSTIEDQEKMYVKEKQKERREKDKRKKETPKKVKKEGVGFSDGSEDDNDFFNS